MLFSVVCGSLFFAKNANAAPTTDYDAVLKAAQRSFDLGGTEFLFKVNNTGETGKITPDNIQGYNFNGKALDSDGFASNALFGPSDDRGSSDYSISKLNDYMDGLQNNQNLYKSCLSLGGYMRYNGASTDHTINPGDGVYYSDSAGCAVPVESIGGADKCPDDKSKGSRLIEKDGKQYCEYFTDNYLHKVFPAWQTENSDFNSAADLLTKINQLNTDAIQNHYNDISMPQDQAGCESLGYHWVPANNSVNPPEQAYCSPNDENGDPIPDPTAPDQSDNGGGETTCNLGSTGWIFCPIATTVSKWIDNAYDGIQKVLQVPVSILQGDGAGTVRWYWSNFLTFANVVLVIVFLIVIYSEATGGGFGAMSNYNIKKTLPKLIIFAVLVNISFWICAAAVDISNILGAGILDAMKDMTNTTCKFEDITADSLKAGDVDSSIYQTCISTDGEGN